MKVFFFSTNMLMKQNLTDIIINKEALYCVFISILITGSTFVNYTRHDKDGIHRTRAHNDLGSSHFYITSQ